MSVTENEVKAVLTAEDRGMTSALRNAAGLTDSLAGKMKRYVGIGAAVAIGQKAISVGVNAVTSSIGSAVSRYDQLNRFPRTLQNLGIGAKEAKKATQALSDGLKGLPTSLDQGTVGVQRFVSANGDINKSTEYFLAMNNAILAGGSSAASQAAAIEQLSQSYAKGKMDMQEWRSINTAMPGQIKQVAKAMGMSAGELGDGLRNGTVSMEDFMDTMVKLNKEGVGEFASFEKQAKDATGGIETSIINVKNAITRGIAESIGAIEGLLKKNNLPTFAGMAQIAGKKIDAVFSRINSIISKIDLKGAIAAAQPYYKAFKAVLSTTISVVSSLARFLAKHAGAVVSVTGAVLTAIAAYKGFKAVQTMVGGLKSFMGALKGIASAATTSAATLPAAAAGEEAVGGASASSAKAVSMSAKSFMQLGVAVLAIGAGLLLAAAGFALLVYSAIQLANAGPTAIAVMAGLVVGLAALAAALVFIAPVSAAASFGLVALGVAVLLVGAGVALAALGMSKLATQLPTIATYGLAGAGAILALGGALTVFAAGMIVAGAGCIVLAAGLLVITPAMALAAGGAALLAGGVALLAGGMALLAGATRLVAKAIGSIGRNASMAASSLKVVAASMKSMGGIGKLSGLAAGIGFAKGIKTGMNQAKTSATTAINAINAKFRSGASGARSAGAYIGKGLANGIRSQLGAVKSAANALVKQANRAIKAKAEIHSPSKVTTKYGKWYGQGFVNGIKALSHKATNVAQDLVSIPSMTSLEPIMVGANFDDSLNDSYSYMNANYTFVVETNIDGKRAAEAIVPHAEPIMERNTKRNNRNRGVRV